MVPNQSAISAATENKRPAETIMISEKEGGGGNQYILDPNYYCCRASHNEGGNVAFVDGHAKWFKFANDALPAPWPVATSDTAPYRVAPPATIVGIGSCPWTG